MSEKKIPGERIKQLRLAANLTLKDVEGKAKVSATHVSEIERGLTSPTVGALVRIAGALGVAPALLMQPDRERPVEVARQQARRVLRVADSAVELTVLSSGGDDLSLLEVSVAPGSGDVVLPLLSGEVFVHVLEGALDVVRDSERHALGEGDSIHTGADGPVLVANPGAVRSRVLCATAPAMRL